MCAITCDTIIIRQEEAADVAAIRHIEYAAFKGHPQHEPGAEPTEHLIVERLREAGDLTVSLVALAESGGEPMPVGHIALSPCAVGQDDAGWYLLGPVGVLPEHQGAGIGSALVREALDLLRGGDTLGVLLVGDPSYYERFGFRSQDGLGYATVPSQYVLALRFTAVRPSGEITPRPAFG